LFEFSDISNKPCSLREGSGYLMKDGKCLQSFDGAVIKDVYKTEKVAKDNLEIFHNNSIGFDLTYTS
jgi:hypothetical protein